MARQDGEVRRQILRHQIVLLNTHTPRALPYAHSLISAKLFFVEKAEKINIEHRTSNVQHRIRYSVELKKGWEKRNNYLSTFDSAELVAG
jgi:hypothetical protein